MLHKSNLRAELTGGGGITLRVRAHPGAPAWGELLIAMRLAPINPADLLMIDGRYGFTPDSAAAVGAEGVGEVVAVGAGTRGFAPGDRVLPLSRGNWQTCRRVAANDVVRVDPALPLEQAAMLRINPATAWRLLETVPLVAGDLVVQNGGRSAVATLVERIGAARGLDVVTVSRHADAAAPLIADGDDLPERLRPRGAGRGARLALDCVAGSASGRLAACLGPRGRLVVFGHLSGAPCQIPSTLLTGGTLTVSGFSLRPAETGIAVEALASFYGSLAELLLAQPLPIASIRPLSQFEVAIAAARHGTGRVLLDLQA